MQAKQIFVTASLVLGISTLALLAYVRLNTPPSHPNFPQEYVEGRPASKGAPYAPEVHWQQPTPRY